MPSSGTGNIIGVVGHKDSGKTRVVEGLVGFLSGKGFSVGTVKHIDHDSSLEPLATDSRRHLDAGARTVVAVGENIVEALTSGGPRAIDLEAAVAEHLFACDFVLVEGFKKEGIPKVAVISDDAAILNEAENIVALVHTTGEAGGKPGGYPSFGPDEIPKLGAHLLENDILKAPGKWISLVVDGKPVRLNEFVRTSLAGVIQGFITSLRDVKAPSTIELRIRK